MPLILPNLDDRHYQDLVDEALARIPVHTPEWTNFNRSDPGVTLIELFAFMTENLLYRCNQIPERNRRKFLSLLDVPMQPASSARGMVTLTNAQGPLAAITLNDGLEVRAGNIPFRTLQGLDVLPIEAITVYKRKLPDGPRADALRVYYNQLYLSHLDGPSPAAAELYETVPFSGGYDEVSSVLDLGDATSVVDRSAWLALLARPSDKADLDAARRAIAGRTISLGIVPYLQTAGRDLLPHRPPGSEVDAGLRVYLPIIPADGHLPRTAEGQPNPDYELQSANTTTNVALEPGVVQITLPADPSRLRLWDDVDPLETGVGNMPPALDDTALADRILTWLRITAPPGATFKLLWAGLNAVMVEQRMLVSNELLGEGNGEPDQSFRVARTPVLPGSARVFVTPALPAAPVTLAAAVTQGSEEWKEIPDLLTAGAEVPSLDPRLPPSAPPPISPNVNMFVIDPESGVIRFGDGMRGRRPPLGATLRVSYAQSMGALGNVGAGAIRTAPALHDDWRVSNLRVSNPIRTWGGADAETTAEGEKQIAGYVQHRDRLVSRRDFEVIVRRTPGIEIGRVEVLPAYAPGQSEQEDDAPGAVTLLLIPQHDADHPDAPTPDRLFLNAVCDYLDVRRLVTTQIFLRGPDYQPIWISIGIAVTPGYSVAQATANVRGALRAFLSPFGWPLRKAVIDRELMAVASREPGVEFVNGDVLIARDTDAPATRIPMKGLQLPYVRGIAIEVGDPINLDQVRGRTGTEGSSGSQPPKRLPLPVIPEECR